MEGNEHPAPQLPAEAAPRPFSARNLVRAAIALAISGGVVALLASGALPCFSAKYLHFPCPGCGATRSTLALFHLDFAGVLRFNPIGPLAAILLGITMARTIYVIARDGHMRGLAEGWFDKLAVRAFMGVFIAEVVLWALRFTGLFGGPCPVG
jgi:hypothetical protein